MTDVTTSELERVAGIAVWVQLKLPIHHRRPDCSGSLATVEHGNWMTSLRYFR